MISAGTVERGEKPQTLAHLIPILHQSELTI